MLLPVKIGELSRDWTRIAVADGNVVDTGDRHDAASRRGDKNLIGIVQVVDGNRRLARVNA